MAVADQLALIAPELSSVDDPTRDSVIELAEGQVGSVFTGVQRELAVAYVTAHMLTLRNRKGAGGFVTGKTEGDLSLSFGAVGGVVGMTEWHATVYGQEFKRMQRMFVFAPRTRVG